MDPRTAIQPLTARRPRFDTHRHRLLPAAAAALTVLVVLAALKEIGGVPKPLVITLALCFLTCSLPLGLIRWRRSRWLAGSMTELLFVWAVASAALLGAAYRLDRGGWIWYRLSGYNHTIAEQREQEIRLSPDEFVARNPDFNLEADDASHIVLPAGDHSFSQTMVIPEGTLLTIEPGTVVRMAVGCSWISYSPIIARGTEREPIVFTAQHPWFKWGVIGLVHAESGVFEHVHLEHARQAAVNGVNFPGGISLIETNAEIRNCRFTDIFGKDAIYALGGRVFIHDNYVCRAFRDGIDFDGASGEIYRNVLVDCDDEGIDLSENQSVDVRHNTIRDRRGGRIAADHDLEQLRLSNTLEFSINR